MGGTRGGLPHYILTIFPLHELLYSTSSPNCFTAISLRAVKIQPFYVLLYVSDTDVSPIYRENSYNYQFGSTF